MQVGPQQRMTLNTLVQGAWALLLSRYSSEDDVVFGATVSGRPLDLAVARRWSGYSLTPCIPGRILCLKHPLWPGCTTSKPSKWNYANTNIVRLYRSRVGVTCRVGYPV